MSEVKKPVAGKVFFTGEVALSKGVLAIDAMQCAGCRNCMYVCSLSHDGIAAMDLARIQVSKESQGVFDVCAEPCMQCANPQCLRYCPKHAISADYVTGARVIDQELCVGCGSCIRHCPYDPPRIRFDAVKRKAVKCDLCGGNPQCVRICPTGALTFRFDPNGIACGYGSKE